MNLVQRARQRSFASGDMPGGGGPAVKGWCGSFGRVSRYRDVVARRALNDFGMISSIVLDMVEVEVDVLESVGELCSSFPSTSESGRSGSASGLRRFASST